MRWFRRRRAGRHALGAAVTSIPSGPPPMPVLRPPAPVASPKQGAPEPGGAPVAPEPDLMTSIGMLLATGEAWASAPAPAAEPAPVAAPAPLAGPAHTGGTASARSSLEAALAELLPLQPAEGEVHHPPAPQADVPRVQLGFRDGSSTALEPGSTESLALEDLARTLTRRD